MNYKALKDIIQEKHDQLFTDCGVFWAFSNDQFTERKEASKLQPGEKLVSIGMGGFLPKRNFAALEAGLKDIKAYEKRIKKRIKAEEAILYELNNYEAFYTGDPMDAYEQVLKDMGYTLDEVIKVYRENYAKYADGVAIN